MIKFLGLIPDKELNMTKVIAAKARTAHFNLEKIKGLENTSKKMRPKCFYAQWYYYTLIMEMQH